jgi:uncharacterized protein
MTKNYNRIMNLNQITKSKSAFLLGPRQTGKTSLIKEQLSDHRIIDLLKSDIFLEFQRAPEKLRALDTSEGELVIIDEIQRVPALLNEVHYLIENRNNRFLLTGSSARKLRKEGVNLLGGRARNYNLLPLTSFELGADFSLGKAIEIGTIPSIYTSDEPQLDLASYIENYLQLEIAVEALTRNLPAFSRFLEIVALSNTKIINYTKIAQDAQISPSTSQEYFQILQDTLMGTVVPAWKEGLKRKTARTSKFYFFDVGVVNAILGRRQINENSSEYGENLEAYIFHELNAYTNYHKLSPITHWRTLQKDEVDFIFNENIAIEVKAKKQISKRELKGLKKLTEEKAHTRYILVCMTPLKQKIENIEIWPVREFLKALWVGEMEL